MSSETIRSKENPKKPNISRRGFLKFYSLMAATLALPTRYDSRISNELSAGTRPPGRRTPWVGAPPRRRAAPWGIG